MRAPRKSSGFTQTEEFDPEDELPPPPAPEVEDDGVMEWSYIDTGGRITRSVTPEDNLHQYAYSSPDEIPEVPRIAVADPERNCIGEEDDRVQSGADEMIPVYGFADDAEEEPPAAGLNFLRCDYLPVLYSLYAPQVLPVVCYGGYCQPDDGKPPLFYRCQECLGHDHFLCEYCCKMRHAALPFHRLDRWDPSDSTLSQCTLSDIGFVYKLGHDGGACHQSAGIFFIPPQMHNIKIMHTNGIHRLKVSYCSCISTDQHVQLLRHGLFPATEKRAQTAFSFATLDQFIRFNLISKISGLDYCQNMQYTTDGVLPQTAPNLYKNFMLVIRQWRALKTLMTNGKTTNAQLAKGELVVACPACPRPGFNIPDNWKLNPNRKLLYGLFVSGDGNFHLQRRRNKAGAPLQDSFFGDAGFWAPQALFDSYVAKLGAYTVAAHDDDGGCNANFKAGDPVRPSLTAWSSGHHFSLAATGIYGLSCRHVLLRSNGVTDFTKGEKYAHVDAATAETFRWALDNGLEDVIFSYDIACKYSVNFLKRVTTAGIDGEAPLISSEIETMLKITWLIGKFHLGGHKEECAKKYSFNYNESVGRMSGELVETIWSTFNALKYQTREMGPGPRRELITAAMNFWNALKVARMSAVTSKAYKSACLQVTYAMARLKGITEGLGTEQVAAFELDSAERGGEQYLVDRTKISYPTRKDTLAELQRTERAAFWEDDEANIDPAAPIPTGSPSGKVLPSQVVDNALKLEEQRAKYRELVKQVTESPDNESLVERVSLKKAQVSTQLKSHYEALAVIAPGLSGLGLTAADPLDDPIALPSSYTAVEREAFGLERLAKVETSLRVAQCHETLEKLRKALGIRSFFTRYGLKTNGTEEQTRAQTSIRRSEHVVKQWAFVYRRSWGRLEALGTTEAELGTLQVLKERDLVLLSRWLEDEEYRSRDSELPWIWTTALRPVTNETPDGLRGRIATWNLEVVRLEWVHATAALDRWTEELHLLKEESRRILVSFGRMADDCESRAPEDPLPSDWAARGFAALSKRIAAGYRELEAVARDDYQKCT